MLFKHMVVPFLALAACIPRGHRYDYEDFARSGSAPVGAPEKREVSADEESLATEARLDAMTRIALARNPDLLEEEERVRERLDRVPPSARLPDLELKYEQWGVPLTRPYALDRADMIMVGVRQSFPAPGSLDAQERMATEEAKLALYQLRSRQLDVIRQVALAYYERQLSHRELELIREHVELTERILDLTRSNFRVGTASEQDVLRVGVELQGLRRDIALLEQRKRSSEALLNALMSRPSHAPLGPPPSLVPTQLSVDLTELERIAEKARPEILAASHAVERSQANVDAADARATWPTFMIGVDYMYMPMAVEDKHGYGAMLSINLPWLNPRHREEVRAAERATAADRRAMEAVRITVRYEVADAWARYESMRARYEITKTDLLPAAEQSFEAAQAAFAGGNGSALALLDALQSLLDVRVDEARALVDLEAAIVDVERAVATDLQDAPLTDDQGAQP